MTQGDAAGSLAVASNGLFQVGMLLLMMAPLFLPDGRLPSPAWRRVVVIFGVAAAFLVPTALFEPGTPTEFEGLTNPLGVEAFGPVFDVIRVVEGPVFFAMLVVGIASVFLRLRRASGQQRQQMKWLALGIAVTGAAAAVEGLTALAGIEPPEVVITFTFAISFLAIPVSIGIAILRTGLYDVDVIINRALVYGALTALLLGAYLLGILAIRNLLPLGSDSDVGVAASTLVVAAMFRPLRTRVQRFIDKRFYRHKYDAATILSAFAQQLRDEMELERITRDAVAVVSETVRPAHASIWLRRTA
jgi:hypothetical protein